MTVSRPDKLSQIETILYEIDMLRYTASKLESRNIWDDWSFLESFLLHFRNLIEFFGNDPKGDNLSILRPEKFWSDRGISEEKLKELYRKDLWEKYEVRKEGQENDKISRYLHHCTEQRVQVKTWDVRGMLDELNPVITKFENLFPSRRSWSPPSKSIATLSQASFSTATPRVVYAPVLGQKE